MTTHPNRGNPIRRSLTTYAAYGRTYLADGWVGDETSPLFSVLVPSDDTAHALDYARAAATGGHGTLVPGTQDVLRVEPVDPEGRRPRNEDRGGLGKLPLAPDGSRWSLTSVRYRTVHLRCDFGARAGAEAVLTWDELRAAAADAWYAQVLRRARQAML